MFNLKPSTIDPRRLVKVAVSCLSVTLGIQQLTMAAAWADHPPQPQLFAQQIVDGLPPPPNLPPSMQMPTAQPSLPPATGVTPSQSAPAIANLSTSTQPYYVVYVNGDSPLLLEQVRNVESGAFLQDREGRRVIQAGLFSDSSRASQQAAALEAQGIGAEVMPLSAVGSTTLQAANSSYTQLPPPVINTPSPVTSPVVPTSSFPNAVSPPDLVPVEQTPREIIFGQADLTSATPVAYSTSSSDSLPDNSYYVVIPGRSRELRDISLRVTQLAVGLNVRENSVVERESPLGPHVIVGPFINRSTASRWDRYFRAFGLSDSRVYYRR